MSVTGCPAPTEIAEGLASLLLPQPQAHHGLTDGQLPQHPRFVVRPSLKILLAEVHSFGSTSFFLKPLSVFFYPVPKQMGINWVVSSVLLEAEGTGAFE